MWLLALAAPSAVFLLALGLLRRQRRRPAGLAAPLALSLTIGFEAVLLNALSAFDAVMRAPLLASHAVVALVAARLWAGRWSRPASRTWLPSSGDARAVAAALTFLAIPVAYSALMYVPNNWDSMTYHLARVAHWLQQGSVAAYETNVARQVSYPPGAEYLLLVLQAIAGSDRLANLVQLAAWVVAAVGAVALARLLGAPRRLAPWAALLFAAAPMALLQASSTQNDLLASALALSMVVACLPFLHARARWRASDVSVAAATIATGVLVKPTAIIVTLPLTAVAVYRSLRGIPRDPKRLPLALRGVALASLVVAAVIGPELARRASVRDRGEFSPFLYSPLAFELDRAVNVARGFARQVPLPASWTDALAADTTRGCDVPGSMCAEGAGRPHEDFARNPVPALMTAALLLTGFVRWRSIPARARTALCAVVSGWILFGLVFRDNVWISRLHLPLFALAPLSAVALARTTSGPRWLRPAAVGAGLVLCSTGVRAAAGNELRPVPNPIYASLGLLPGTYYAARSQAWPGHVQTMSELARSGCDRLGLYIGGDSYDYPLTWRAMQQDIEVRHVTGPDPWPCVVHSDRGRPPPPPGGGWCSRAETPGVFVPCKAVLLTPRAGRPEDGFP